MSFKILGLGDPHINSEDDFNISGLRSWLERVGYENAMYDAVFVAGDVIDNVPNDREHQEVKAEDIELGRMFFEELNELGEDYDVPILAQSGNHDNDIHYEITDSFENIYNMNNSVYSSEELGSQSGYTFVTRGAQQFDLRPEIDYRQYSFFQDADSRMERKQALEDLERTLMHAGEANHDLEAIEEAEEQLGIQDDKRDQFKSEILDYFDNHDEATGLFEEAISKYGEDNRIIFTDHIAPFNTALDTKNVDGDKMDHWGSISDKNAINIHEPIVSINGHQHLGQVDFIEGYGMGTTVINLGKREASDIIIGSGVEYKPFN